MKLKELLQGYDFDEIFPSITLMYPNAKRHKKEFKNAYEIMLHTRAVPNKSCIRYRIIEDEVSNSSYFGAEDKDFKTSWEMLLGMDVRKDGKVDLTQEEVLANCLINAIFIGKHPQDFEADYNILIRA